MINSDINSNGLGNSATGIATFHKQPPIATKKVALRDVHNNDRSLLPNGKESLLLVEGRTFTDAAKVCGTKRLTPEHSSTHASPPPLSKNATNEHFIYGRKKLESEAGKGRIQGNTHKLTDCPPFRNFPHVQHELPPKQTQLNEKNMHCPPFVTRPNHMAPIMTYSNITTPVPNFLGKPGKVISEATQTKGTGDQQRRERFVRLQNYIKHCDESSQRENVQMLLHLSPAELSKRAVELEKRAIQLTIEEGKEMQRMKALNILGKSVPTKTPLQTTQIQELKINPGVNW